MRKIKQLLTIVLFTCALLLITPFVAKGWTGPNWYKHWETPFDFFGLYHHGEMEIQPSYNDGGYHYARGSFTFDNGPDGKVVTYTDWGSGPNDNRIYNAYKKYNDFWDFQPRPGVTFNYSSVKAKVGSPYWPVSYTVTK